MRIGGAGRGRAGSTRTGSFVPPHAPIDGSEPRRTCAASSRPRRLDLALSPASTTSSTAPPAATASPRLAAPPPFASRSSARSPARSARQRPAHRRPACDRRHRRDRHRHRPVSSARLAAAGPRVAIPALVDWLRRMHPRGALLCSACSGIFLLAETGLFDGKDATVHFGYARPFTTPSPACPSIPSACSSSPASATSSSRSGASDDLARSRPLSDRAPRRRDGGPGGRAHVRPAMAPGRARALHRLRRQPRPRRRADPSAQQWLASTSPSPTRSRR